MGTHIGGHHSGGYSGGSGGGFGGMLGHYDFIFHHRHLDAEDLFTFIIDLVFLSVGIVFAAGSNLIPGMNLMNTAVFVLSAVIFVPSIRAASRAAALGKLKRKPEGPFTGEVWSRSLPKERIEYLNSFAGTDTRGYRISFSDGAGNAEIVKNTLDKTSGILWLSPFVWMFLAFLCFVSTFFFYDLVIVFFENMDLSDLVFAVIDETIFYLPAAASLLLSILCRLFLCIRDNLLYKCALEIVETAPAPKDRATKNGFSFAELQEKWYYDFCPKCGTLADRDSTQCQNCGTHLEVVGGEKDLPEEVHHLEIK